MIDKKRCPRCLGQKFMYEINGGYAAVNSGGKKVDCPCCKGEGKITSLENASDEIKEEVNKLKQKNSKKRVESELSQV